MSYDNIRLRKSNFTIVDGYFWMMDEDTDSIVVKTDDGTLAYSYPLTTTISTPVISMEYDGHNIWTLQDTGTDELTITRWTISNYVCDIEEQFVLVPSSSHKFDSDAFTVEHYHTDFSGPETLGATLLSVNDGSDMLYGNTLFLGPNSSGQSEEVTVSTADATSVTITSPITYNYLSGDPISFYTNIWLFNNYDGVDDTTGALYTIDAYTGSVITKLAAGAYVDVKACTFFDPLRSVFDKTHTGSEKYNSIVYVKGTNLLFLDPTDLSTTFGSMAMDNIEDDQATNITIYDLAMYGTNVHRLQRKATYYGTTATFADSTYSYQLSSLNSFITSINLSADPAILPANGVNPATIVAVVRDQFNLPINARQVFFTDDDTVGGIVSSPVNTDSDGIAETTYVAGTSAREVRISATAQQT